MVYTNTETWLWKILNSWKAEHMCLTLNTERKQKKNAIKDTYKSFSATSEWAEDTDN